MADEKILTLAEIDRLIEQHRFGWGPHGSDVGPVLRMARAIAVLEAKRWDLCPLHGERWGVYGEGDDPLAVGGSAVEAIEAAELAAKEASRG